MPITRNDALEQLKDLHEISQDDPETAHTLADSILLEIIDDEFIRHLYRRVTRYDVLGELSLFTPTPQYKEGDTV